MSRRLVFVVHARLELVPHRLLEPVAVVPVQITSPLLLLRWKSWEPGQLPFQLDAAEFEMPPRILPECGGQEDGPGFHVAGVPGWSAWLGAHAKAADDHIKFIGKSPPFAPCNRS